jgi:putative glutamine amidotransferase
MAADGSSGAKNELEALGMTSDHAPPRQDRSPVMPLIGVSACYVQGENGRAFHKVGDKYVDSVIDGAGGLPLLIPAIGARLDLERLLDAVDGLLITGSPSNVEPHHYAGAAARRDSQRDPARDATTLPLIRAALDRGVPLLAICRGIQELNVALGGSLHQHVHEVPGRFDHRSDQALPLADRFDQMAHQVTLTPGGRLQAVLAGPSAIEVNTLHGQAIDRLADRLEIEALAPDGTIEAVSVKHAAAFALGIQWHPEWKVLENPHSRRLFAAFGAACGARAQSRYDHGRAVPDRNAGRPDGVLAQGA